MIAHLLRGPGHLRRATGVSSYGRITINPACRSLMDGGSDDSTKEKRRYWRPPAQGQHDSDEGVDPDVPPEPASRITHRRVGFFRCRGTCAQHWPGQLVSRDATHTGRAWTTPNVVITFLDGRRDGQVPPPRATRRLRVGLRATITGREAGSRRRGDEELRVGEVERARRPGRTAMLATSSAAGRRGTASWARSHGECEGGRGGSPSGGVDRSLPCTPRIVRKVTHRRSFDQKTGGRTGN